MEDANCNQDDKRRQKPSYVSWWEENLRETIRLNREGIECMEHRKFAAAVKLFANALDRHDRLKTEVQCMMSPDGDSGDIIVSAADKNTTAAGAENCADADTPNRNHGAAVPNNKTFDKFFFHSDLFVQQDHQQGDIDLVFCEPIRIPATIEDVEVLISETCRGSNNSSSACEAASSSPRTLSEWVSTANDLLSSYHTYNFAISHHLRGIELMREDKDRNNPGVSPERSLYKKYLETAYSCYKLTIRLEQKRQNKNIGGERLCTRVDPRVVLACLNNLADLDYRDSQNSSVTAIRVGAFMASTARCRSCYRHLQIITRRMWEALEHLDHKNRKKSRLLEEHVSQLEVSRSYIQIFARNARQGFFRLWRSTVSKRRNDGDEDKEHPNLYVLESTTAGAA